jgi:predicted DNA-binding protein YlxM (UPF0122 family)
MNRQTFFLSPKFNKKPIYNSPTNKYQEFTNAYVYSVMVKTSNHTPNHAAVCQEAINEWNNIKKKSVDDIDDAIWNYMATPLNLYDIQSMRYKRSVPTEKPNPPPFIHSVEPLPEIPANASAQRRAADEIQIAEKKIYEFEQIYNIASDAQIRDDMYQKTQNLRDEVKSNKDRISKLKKNAKYAQTCKEKKLSQLIENKEVVRYDKPGKPPLLFKHPDLHERIHDCVEFGSADAK